MIDLRSERVRRDIVLLLVGALFGAGIGAGLALVFDDDEAGTTPAAATDAVDENGQPVEDTTPVIDPTKTDFGELTDGASEAGVKVQWTAEILEGPDTGVVEFVTAHKGGVTVIEHEGTRLVDDGRTVRICNGSCQAADAAEAASKLPAIARPFWDIIRLVEETTSRPEYRITGETQLESGIFERCGTFDARAFGVSVPQNVNLVSQCVDAQRGVPIRLGLAGEQRSVGGASLTAIADANPDLFKT